MTELREIPPEEVKKGFPRFYDRQGKFFEIVHKEKDIGFLGVRPLSEEECEIEVYIFPRYRTSLTKGLVFDVLDFPKSLGFKRGIMTTTRPGVLRWLHFLVKCAKLDREFKNGNPYFVRPYS